MKLNVSTPATVVAAAIRCVLPVNYGDEDMPTDFPHRSGNQWDVTVDIDTGQIRDWPAGTAPLDLYMKVVDGGHYYLLDSGGAVLGKRESEYVPDCIPGDYGDYVDFKIDAGGRITNWQLDSDEVRDTFIVSGD